MRKSDSVSDWVVEGESSVEGVDRSRIRTEEARGKEKT